MNLLKKAHELTKEIKREYPEIDYKAQLGICISYLSNKEEVEMVELEGTEKQIAWAKKIREELIEKVENSNSEYKEAILNAIYKATPAVWFINKYNKMKEDEIDNIDDLFKALIRKINR